MSSINPFFPNTSQSGQHSLSFTTEREKLDEVQAMKPTQNLGTSNATDELSNEQLETIAGGWHYMPSPY